MLSIKIVSQNNLDSPNGQLWYSFFDHIKYENRK